ncbi:MAG: hypothetical protein GC151_05710 [Betaproteobacteria bacterium]|nr:hypothetical protein [Betaproteobacteria bacterium]
MARSRLTVTLIALAGLAITVSACIWQYGRGREKDRIAAEAEAGSRSGLVDLDVAPVSEPALRFRRIRARGIMLPHTTILMDNQPHGSQPGYLVFTAMRLQDGRNIVVKRGWIAGSLNRSELPKVPVPDGTVQIEGVALPPSYRFLELAHASLDGPVWQNVTVARYEQRFGLHFEPLVFEQHSDSGDGLVRDWPKPASGSAMHYGYAFQWGSMATLIVILYVYFTFRKRPA